MSRAFIRQYLKPYHKMIVIDRCGREHECVFIKLKDGYIHTEHPSLGKREYLLKGEYDFKPKQM